MSDLDSIYLEMQSGVCAELDDIMQGINYAWDSDSKNEYLQSTGLISRLLDETAEDIKQLKEKMLTEYRKSICMCEQNESEEG